MEGVSYQGSCHALLISGPAEFLNPGQRVLRQPLEFPRSRGTMIGIHGESQWTVKFLYLNEQYKGRGEKAGAAPPRPSSTTAAALATASIETSFRHIHVVQPPQTQTTMS